MVNVINESDTNWTAFIVTVLTLQPLTVIDVPARPSPGTPNWNYGRRRPNLQALVPSYRHAAVRLHPRQRRGWLPVLIG